MIDRRKSQLSAEGRTHGVFELLEGLRSTCSFRLFSRPFYVKGSEEDQAQQELKNERFGLTKRIRFRSRDWLLLAPART